MNQNLKPVIAVAGLSLAFSVAFTGLVGCNNGGNGDDETTTGMPSIYDTTTEDPTNTTDPADVTTDPDDVTTEEVYVEDAEKKTVYVTVENVYLRSAPVIADNTIVGYGAMGEGYTRVRYSDKWCVILLENEEVYISASCVSTEKPGVVDMKFNAVDKTVYVTNAETLNLRNLPSVDNSVVIALAVKDQALVAIGLSEDGNWYKINYKSPEGVESIVYASAAYLTDVVVGADFTALNKKVRITADTLSVRNAPSVEGELVGIVAKDDVINVIGVSPAGDWYKVKYTPSNGSEGEYYMTASSKFVADVEESSTTTEAEDVTTAADVTTEADVTTDEVTTA